jgi:catechol 2,3-dioxygenase
MIKLNGIGHVLLRVVDVERSKKFYAERLGFEVVEQDPEHGGVFMALEGQSHAIDLFPVKDPAAARRELSGAAGLGHIAFRVASEAELRDAYFELQAHGVPITRAVDHVSQKSIYFQDPDGNVLEIYYERPDARELFRQGREDRDAPLVFDPPGEKAYLPGTNAPA